MKFLVVTLVAAVAFAAVPPKPAVQAAQPAKEAYEISFDKIKADYLQKNIELEKARKVNQETAKKAVISDSTLKIQQDSSAVAAKKLLKATYDAEIVKITTQEGVLKLKKARIDSLYSATLSSFDKK